MTFHYRYNRTLVPFAKENKKEQTDAEKLLWYKLRNRQLDMLQNADGVLEQILVVLDGASVKKPHPDPSTPVKQAASYVRP